MKTLILNLTLSELQEKCAEHSLPKFTAKQIFEWIYQKYVTHFDDMSNISKANREILKAHFTTDPFLGIQKMASKDGLATKYLFKLSEKETIEAVVLKEKNYNTLCISSQCGCPVDCKFCLTGVAGFKKNLSSGEILAQLLFVQKEGHQISNLVFMGMGEPLLNFKHVFKAIDLITDEKGFGISKRKVTVSTSGYIQSIKRLIEEERAVNLAFSVGNPNPLKRIKLMPCEQRNPIVEVSRLLKHYLSLHNRKLTLEYTLLKGVNDGKEEALELAYMGHYLNAKVNLINLNPHPRIPFTPVSSEALTRFKQQLKDRGAQVTIRFTKGLDIVAACGQLGESLLKPTNSQ